MFFDLSRSSKTHENNLITLFLKYYHVSYTKCNFKSVQNQSGIMPMNRPARRQAGMFSPIEFAKIRRLHFFNRYYFELRLIVLLYVGVFTASSGTFLCADRVCTVRAALYLR